MTSVGLAIVIPIAPANIPAITFSTNVGLFGFLHINEEFNKYSNIPNLNEAYNSCL